MPNLQMTTCLAVNTIAFTQALADHLQAELGLPTAYLGDDDLPWADRLTALASGQIHMGWICGWPYVRMTDRMKDGQAGPIQTGPVQTGPIEVLAAPVLQANRYTQQPIYFADLIVRHDAPQQSVADLRGTVWAYNEPGSLSGWLSVRSHLAATQPKERRTPADFFAQSVESGGHALSLALLLEHKVDCAAIDSTLLDYWLQNDPTLAAKIRLLQPLGPFPIPPFVIHGSVPAAMRQRIRDHLLQMHQSARGQQVLQKANISHFVIQKDAAYNPVRHMSAQIRIP